MAVINHGKYNNITHGYVHKKMYDKTYDLEKLTDGIDRQQMRGTIWLHFLGCS